MHLSLYPLRIKTIMRRGTPAALCVSLLACGGGSSPTTTTTTSTNPPYTVNVRDTSVVQAETANELHFELLVDGLSDAEQLNCSWLPNINDSSLQEVAFSCIVGQLNTTQFQLATPGDYTGRLTIVVPGQNNSTENLTYTISAPEETATVDVSSQFGAELVEQFYLFQQRATPDTLLYFPKKLALESAPGIASVSRRNLVNELLELFLSQSNTDWNSEAQITLSSRYSLDVDKSQLNTAAESMGFDRVDGIEIQSPIVYFERRYVTDINQDDRDLRCENITLEIETVPATLIDCVITEPDSALAPQSINWTADASIETREGDLGPAGDISAIKGNFSVEYTLPGTVYFDQVFSSANVNLSSTFQIHYEWPALGSVVAQQEVTFVWSDIIARLVERVENQLFEWQASDINEFVSDLLAAGALAFSEADTSPQLTAAIAQHLRSELFVSLYSTSDSENALLYIPRLRFENTNVPLRDETKNIRYLSEGPAFYSTLNLSCLQGPDSAGNLTRSSECN
ncbi:MAG: hypothetical protein KTR17_08460 [Cellvibrionaceae bacterium]|nr:hypothetical protein [Cellvibrionaceae bacterium]